MTYSSSSTIPVVIVSGVPGAGKTTAAEALADQLAHHQVPHAMIDLDYLCQSFPLEDSNSTLMFENLNAVWPNYARRGARMFVGARVIEHTEQMHLYRAAIPNSRLVVVGVTAPEHIIDERLAQRESGDWIPKMQALSRKLRPVVENGGFADFTVSNVGKSSAELGAEILNGLVSRNLLDVAALQLAGSSGSHR